MSAHLEITDDIAVLNLGDDENRFSPDWLTTMSTASSTASSPVRPRPWSPPDPASSTPNGLDLDWLGAHSDQGDWYIDQVHQLLARVLVAPVPTVAAINGHAFGAGSMLGIAHDFRVMRADRGYFCFPEVDIHIPFSPGMAAIIQAKLTPAAAVEAMTTGRRYGGADAEAIGLVTASAPEDKLTTTAVDLVTPFEGQGSRHPAGDQVDHVRQRHRRTARARLSPRHNGHVPDLQQTVDAVWRMEAAKIVATLTRAVGDVGLAEDLAQEALVDALTQWPSSVCRATRAHG